MQNLLCTLKGYQLDHQRHNGQYNDVYRQLIKSDEVSYAEIIRYKEAETYKILDYAYRHCPYYKSSFLQAGVTPADFKTMEDLLKFPVLTKEDVRTYWMGMISDEANPKTMIRYHTSGSTGKALDFYWTKDSLAWYWATVWRGRKRCGIEKGDLHLNFTGKLVVPFSQQSPPYWRYNAFLHQYMLNMQHITIEKVPVIVKFINETDLRFMVGYSSIIYSFTQLVEELGLTIDRVPSFMFPSGEILYDYQRKQILRVFPGIQIMEHYGFSENAACASKCLKGHYHEDYEMGHLELIDIIHSNKEDVGQLVATGFKNMGMPFIRYEIGDIATFSKEKCYCGLQSQVIAAIEGRNGDYVITPEGTKIMRFSYLFKDTRNIKECQVVQRKIGEVTLRIVRRDGYTKTTESTIIELAHSMISPTILVNFEYVDEIERTKAGKFRAVVSELNKNR
ncbi:phenylacetate--CoA ligase family protein [uncultured Parabacteroides sp.]|uniref:phenylacetate--CoA ligase family protein n=1 Tax=uncultured Parabacteroides sp. TaxID=512312 RepID=UPI00260A2865|nr:phenylacetate--CoA ligase family protein [uncultured Parabacteroides sp.]